MLSMPSITGQVQAALDAAILTFLMLSVGVASSRTRLPEVIIAYQHEDAHPQ